MPDYACATALGLALTPWSDYGPAGAWLGMKHGGMATEQSKPLDSTPSQCSTPGWPNAAPSEPATRDGCTPSDFLFVERGRRLGAVRLAPWSSIKATVLPLATKPHRSDPRTSEDPKMSPNASAPVQAVMRTMASLELLSSTEGGMAVGQLAHALGIEKSLASRLLNSLHAGGYVVRNAATDHYELSLKILSLASRYSDRIGFPSVVQPILTELADNVKELVQLSAIEGHGLALISHAQTRRHGLTILPIPGSYIPPHATAAGKAWLASLGDNEAIERALTFGFERLTSSTIGTVEALIKDLREVRIRGYSTNLGEYTDDINALGVAIGKGRFGKTVGTVSVSAPATRMGLVEMEEISPVLIDAASAIESIWPRHATVVAGQ